MDVERIIMRVSMRISKVRCFWPWNVHQDEPQGAQASSKALVRPDYRCRTMKMITFRITPASLAAGDGELILAFCDSNKAG